MAAVEKQLICLEDIAVGTGVVIQTRGGAAYTLTRIDLVPSVDAVEDLDDIVEYTRAKVGLTNYKKVGDEWVIDRIPLNAVGELGAAASRGVTGVGDLIARGFAGIGGPALSGILGNALGMQASLVSTVAAGGPENALFAVLTLPGLEANAVQIAFGATSPAIYYKIIGSTWIPVVLANSSPTFAAVKATSVRADSIGTPKE